MDRYAAFLRGINISGKNKIAMPALKAGFEDLGFSDVVTYLNSGNVLFSDQDREEGTITNLIETMIHEKFGFLIPVHVVRVDSLRDILEHAPGWWGTEEKEKYHNLIFVLSPAMAEDICRQIGEPTKELEKISVYRNVIFWTFERKEYSKCNWWKKTAGAGIGEKLTIRTANTVKICFSKGIH